MAVVIEGVPTKIPRADYLALIESLGLDLNDLTKLVFHLNSVEACVLARDEQGHHYVVPDTNEAAMHVISIPVED